MNKLAKQLKEAGFPQNLNGKDVLIINCKYCANPTLSELIEACGNDFESLCRVPDGQLLDTETGQSIGVMWQAYPTDEAYVDKIKGDCVVGCCGYETGSTKEEAVAKLWLALNING